MPNKIKIYQLNGKGGAVEVALENIDLNHALTWIQLDLTGIKSFFKKNLFPIPEFVKEMLCAKETRPRATVHENTLLLNLRGVNLNPNSNPEDMVSIRAWVSENLILTVQKRNLFSVQEIEKMLMLEAGPKSSANFLEMLVENLVEKTADVIINIGEQLDLIEDNLSQYDLSKMRIKLNNIRRRIIILRRYLVPQRNAIAKMNTDQLTWVTRTDSIYFNEATDMHIRIMEDLDAEREQANVMHEELFALSQEAINQKMYYLTIVAIIFMPLSFITGLLGINVDGIPGATFKHGFLTVSMILVIIFIIQLFYLRKRKWI